MKVNKKRFSIFIILMVTIALLVSGCGKKDGAQSPPQGSETIEFPTKTITLSVWSSAGSPGDIFVRQVANVLEKEFDQTVVVRNIEGAGGANSLNHILRQDADGYSINLVTQSTMVGFLTGQFPTFSPDDFEYIARVQIDPYLLAVHADSPFDTIEDLIQYSKENPGKLNIGGFITGSSPHMAFISMLKETDAKLEYIPYDGGAEAVAAAVGQHVDGVWTNLSAVLSQVKAGNLKVLATTSAERMEQIPDVPTLTETGYEVVEGQWRGILTKKGVPEEILDMYDAAIAQAIKHPDFQQYLEQTGTQAAYMGHKEFSEFVQWEMNELGNTLEELGLKQ